MQQIQLPRYTIFIDDLETAVTGFLEQNAFSQAIILMDENTEKCCFPVARPFFKSLPFKNIVVAPGESHKNLDTCRLIWEELFNAGADRKSLLACLGGGVLGDMGGFCAATFKRGIAFAQVPTTLLSQVDSSIGGKLGIDFMQIKNSIGVFSDPAAVFISRDFLKTLPQRELRSGFAEMLKHALIADARQWKRLVAIEQIDFEALEKIQNELGPSLMVKKRIVQKDPFEKGVRKALNFGHTVGHAVESLSLETDKPLLHGEAIAIGMICEAFLSQELLSMKKMEEIVQVFLRLYGHYDLSGFDFARLLDVMRQDKKNEGGSINFTLLTRIGAAVVNQTALDRQILDSLAFYRQL